MHDMHDMTSAFETQNISPVTSASLTLQFTKASKPRLGCIDDAPMTGTPCLTSSCSPVACATYQGQGLNSSRGWHEYCGAWTGFFEVFVGFSIAGCRTWTPHRSRPYDPVCESCIRLRLHVPYGGPYGGKLTVSVITVQPFTVHRSPSYRKPAVP
jgi:hypothetical protein